MSSKSVTRARRVVCGLAAAVLILIPEVAKVGQLHIKKIELGELIRRSTHIVIAVPDDPPTVEEQVVIKARGKKPPPYVRWVDHFHVRESLRGDLAPGQAIAVVPADDALRERLHREYHTTGLSRHVAVDRYEQQAITVSGDVRILFLISHGERLAYTVGGGAEGLARRDETERLLGSRPITAGKPHAALVDQALRTHGDFGVYGDLRAGLRELSRDFKIRLSDVENGIQVIAIPRSGRGHEFHFVVNTDGTINPPMVGESEPVIPRLPQSLVFKFDNLRLAKQSDTISLTIEPVWRDAQCGPPPDFEQGKRVLRMSTDDFQRFWAELNAVDLAYYAHVTDADFETTPPDLRHTELLAYSVNGKEIVSWGRDYQWLRAGPREPLLNIQRQLTEWADEQLAPAPGPFRRIQLRDVQGLYGGQNVTVLGDRNVVVQHVTPVETGLHERRFEFVLSEEQWQELQQLIARHPPGKICIPARPGIPDQARPEISLIAHDGSVTTVAKWDDDRQADFDALYNMFLRLAQQTQKLKPVWEGRYASDWLPE